MRLFSLSLFTHTEPKELTSPFFPFYAFLYVFRLYFINIYLFAIIIVLFRLTCCVCVCMEHNIKVRIPEKPFIVEAKDIARMKIAIISYQSRHRQKTLPLSLSHSVRYKYKLL